MRESNDIVCLSTGTLTEVRVRHGALSAAGIDSRVVGDHLTAGLGTALPGTVELWVHRDDLRAALEQLGGRPAGQLEPREQQEPQPDAVPDLAPFTEHGST